jgi:hypothetical protein
MIGLTPNQLARDSEHSQQVALFAWAALETKNYPQLKWLYAVPNGFFASSGQKSKMKAEGLRDGVPDLFLPVPINLYVQDNSMSMWAGLYIEMKREIYRTRKDGGCSEDQLKWLAYLNEVGYKAVVCYGWEEARDTILEYLNG